MMVDTSVAGGRSELISLLLDLCFFLVVVLNVANV